MKEATYSYVVYIPNSIDVVKLPAVRKEWERRLDFDESRSVEKICRQGSRCFRVGSAAVR